MPSLRTYDVLGGPSREHIFPEAFGGHKTILACTDCNSGVGTGIEGQLLGSHAALTFFQQGSGLPHKELTASNDKGQFRMDLATGQHTAILKVNESVGEVSTSRVVRPLGPPMLRQFGRGDTVAKRRANHEGSIYQRSSDDRWIGAIRMGYGPNGRRLRKYVSAKTRGEVARKLKVLQRQFDDGLLPKDGHITLSTLFERWSDDVMRHQVEASTLRNYLSIARIHILPTLGHKKLIDLNVNDVDRLLSLKRDSGLAPSTVRRIRVVLAQCLNQAIRWGLLFRNVAILSRSPKAVRSEGRTLSPDQARHFLDTLKGHRNEALFALMLSTGLRRGEALGLMWTDFDREAGVIRVARQLKREGRALVTTDTKTFRSRRAVNLPDMMMVTLLEHEKFQLSERERRGTQWVDTGFIFTTTRGTPIDPRNFYREFRQICDEAGLGHWHPHELRHSAASLMLAQGVKLHVVSQVLGHSSIRMTSDVYGHLLEPDREDAALAMGALLWDADDDVPG